MRILAIYEYLLNSRKHTHKNIKRNLIHNISDPHANLEDISTMDTEENISTFFVSSKIIETDLILAKVLGAAEWHKVTESKNPSKNVKKLNLTFSKKKKEIKEYIRTFNRDRRAKFLDRDTKIVASQNNREHWKWVSRLLSEDLHFNHKLSALRKDISLDINHDISWEEVKAVLMGLALLNAPGCDGFGVLWYKLLFNDYDVYSMESPMAKALHTLLQAI
ncbi:hypothetical protein AYI70_g8285 [Smittium culicis]|uniref:Uncharacterized protein n=1 Tax=Smittium culicis TaxID=133412 RepID=A0A1R1XGN7_9FUNG|nr:hypothetical protein AYI70_g8285 [Smittium culicis]